VTVYHAPYAWLPTGLAREVRIEVAGGVFTAVTPDCPPSGERLPGLVLPGFANVHSHAFHRVLRGRTHGTRGSFWTWRDLMYATAARLDPDSYFALARAVYAEMALAGITAVGEFHYLHHGPDGTPYADPNAMGHALVAAAAEAGIRITLLDTLYLTAGVDGKPLEGVQRRFGDGDLDGWSERTAQLRAQPHSKIGAALHSVRAVPADCMSTFAYRTDGQPVHVHLSEQRAENEQCRAVHGLSPAELLDVQGVWQPGTVAVHATHLSDRDVEILGDQHVCFCPTTERDLADGIGPARRQYGQARRHFDQRELAVFHRTQAVTQTRKARQRKQLVYRRAPQVGIDQQHTTLVGLRKRQRQIRGGQRLAFAGQRARHHDHADPALVLRVVQDRGEPPVLLD